MARRSISEFDDIFQKIEELSGEESRLLPNDEDEVKARVEKSKRDPQFFYKTYLSDYFKDDPAQFHLEIPKLFDHKQQPLVILAPRGGAKSTFLFGETLRLIVTGQQKFLVRVEESEVIARKEIFKIKTEIESNPQLRNDFGDLVGSPWSASELYFSNGCMMWGRGRRQPVRGVTFKQWRPTGIIYNDVETQKQVSNALLTDEIYSALETEALPALNPATSGGGFLAIVGTLLGSKTMLGRILEHPMAIPIRYKALLGDDASIMMLLELVSRDVDDIGRHCRKYKGKSKRDVIRRREYFTERQEYVDVIKRGKIKSYWPARYPVEELLLICASTGTPAFKQEYLHKPIDDELSGAFNEAWFTRRSNTYDVMEVPQHNLVRATFLDPSYRDTSTSDNKAFVTGFYDVEDQCGYVINVTVGQMSFDDMIRKSFEITKEFLLGNVKVYQQVHGQIVERDFTNDCFIDAMFGYEDNGAQQWLESVFLENGRKYTYHLPKLTGITHTGNKHARISRLSYYIERGKLKMNPTQESHALLIHELCNLSDRSAMDDAADALEGWWSLVERTTSSIIFLKNDRVAGEYERGRNYGTFRDPMYRIGDRERYTPRFKRT